MLTLRLSSQCLLIQAKGNVSIQERQSDDLPCTERVSYFIVPVSERQNDWDGRVQIGLKTSPFPAVYSECSQYESGHKISVSLDAIQRVSQVRKYITHMKNEQKKNMACSTTVMFSRALTMLVLISAVVRFQLKSRLNTATLYKVRNARIVFPSTCWNITIRRAYFESDKQTQSGQIELTHWLCCVKCCNFQLCLAAEGQLVLRFIHFQAPHHTAQSKGKLIKTCEMG